MQRIIRNKLNIMVSNKLNLDSRQTNSVVKLMVIKNDIDKGNITSALNGILGFILRESDLGPVHEIDDLTKMLNTSGEDFDSARVLIDGINKDEV